MPGEAIDETAAPDAEETLRLAEAALAGADAGLPGEPEAGLAPADCDAAQERWSLELMLDVPLDVTVELGRTSMQLGEALALQMGSIIELNRLPGEPLDMHINARLVARGEVVEVNETLGLRVTEIVNRETRRAKRGASVGM